MTRKETSSTLYTLVWVTSNHVGLPLGLPPQRIILILTFPDRVLISNWTARPSYPPTVNFTSSSPNEVFASWNGATEVASWDLFGSTSSSPQHAILLNSTKKVDFETGIGFSQKGNAKIEFFQVAAKNVRGKVLGFSEFRSRDGRTVSVARNQTVEVAPLD
jgi:hypothetical protein